MTIQLIMTIQFLLPFFLVGFMFFVPLAAAPLSNSKNLKKGIYEEDLPLCTMDFCKPPKTVKKMFASPLVCPLDQTKLLAARLAARKAAYQRTDFLKGYTIQLYVGTSRRAALYTQDLVGSFSYPSTLHYRQPYYSVQVGFFFDRVEAYFLYLTLVQKIPSAMICPSIQTTKG